LVAAGGQEDDAGAPCSNPRCAAITSVRACGRRCFVGGAGVVYALRALLGASTWPSRGCRDTMETMVSPLAETAVGAMAATILAGCSTQGCPSEGEGFSAAQVVVTVVDAVSGAEVCDAFIAASSPCAQCGLGAQFKVSAESDASCVYTLSVTTGGQLTAQVTASGFHAQVVAIDIPSKSCGQVSGLIDAPLVRLFPECATPIAHDDGLGGSWTDCVPAHTYDQTEATAACASYYATASCTLPVRCSGLDGGSGVAVCDFFSGDTETPCACWTFEGSGAGHAHFSDAGCGCASTGDPSWY
jgi:hypothetical protein